MYYLCRRKAIPLMNRRKVTKGRRAEAKALQAATR